MKKLLFLVMVALCITSCKQRSEVEKCFYDYVDSNWDDPSLLKEIVCVSPHPDTLSIELVKKATDALKPIIDKVDEGIKLVDEKYKVEVIGAILYTNPNEVRDSINYYLNAIGDRKLTSYSVKYRYYKDSDKKGTLIDSITVVKCNGIYNVEDLHYKLPSEFVGLQGFLDRSFEGAKKDLFLIEKILGKKFW